MIEEVMRGFNCTVFAYGQTGTGKTYTMEGENVENGETSDGGSPNVKSGVIIRAVTSLFERVELEAEYLESTISCSHLEIYNEELCDLLNEDDQQKLCILLIPKVINR
eukprot:UN03676